VKDKERITEKFEDVKQQKLLDENSAQTPLELSKALNVTPMAVSNAQCYEKNFGDEKMAGKIYYLIFSGYNIV